MLSITLDQPGQFSRHDDAPAPTPGPGEALVRVHRIGVCGTDLHAFAGRQPFFAFPRILGHELGVEIIDPGDAPGDLRAGDRCSVEPYLNCGHCVACRHGKPNCCASLQVLGVHTDGGMRPLLTVPARKLHRSAHLDYEQLALIETLGIGAHAVERAAPHAADFVLVIGAGPIGLSVVPFAVETGARVAVLDISAERLAFCQRECPTVLPLVAGPDLVADLQRLGDGDLPTVIIDATGNPQSMARTFELAAQGGRIVFVGLFQGDVSFNDPNFHRRELTLLASRNALPSTFDAIIKLVESGRLDPRRWITHRTTLADVPTTFPTFPGAPGLVKAMIEV